MSWSKEEKLNENLFFKIMKWSTEFDKILKNNIFFSGEDNLIFPAGHYIMSVDIVNREARREMQIQSSLGITSLDHQYYETKKFNTR